ncbi:hypothetical protein J2S46_000583 [Kitasatospora herbaricolor]|nr:hypothetical protein [Kitasatospora herbaricolor]MDQ0306027.1 hypothetical protein [Kitasatospora herbaricolor]
MIRRTGRTFSIADELLDSRDPRIKYSPPSSSTARLPGDEEC